MTSNLVSCAVDGYAALWIEYADGVAGRVDLMNVLELSSFRMLRDFERFSEVRVRAGAVVWPCGVQLDSGVLYMDLVARGCKPRPRCVPGPMSQEQLVAIAGDKPFLRFRRALLRAVMSDDLDAKSKSSARPGRVKKAGRRGA